MEYDRGVAIVTSSGLSGDGDALDGAVSRAKQGDVHAFEILVRENEREVLRTAHLLLGNLQDAEDAAQETFLRLHKYLGRFRDGLALRPWLYRVTVNACRDAHRKRVRHAAQSLETVPERELEAAGRPDRTAEAEEEWGLMMQGLQSLPEKERAAFVLRDIEGLSTKDVARTLGSTQLTVRSQISRARLKLKRFRDRYTEAGL